MEFSSYGVLFPQCEKSSCQIDEDLQLVCKIGRKKIQNRRHSLRNNMAVYLAFKKYENYLNNHLKKL